MRDLVIYFGKILYYIEMAMLRASIFAIFVITILVCTDIVGRRYPAFMIPDSVEIARSLLLMSISLGLAYVTMAREHISVDLLYNLIGKRSQRVCDVVVLVASLCFAIPMAIWLLTYAYEVYVIGRTYFGYLRLPQWINYLALALGFSVVALRLLQQLAAMLLSIEETPETEHL